MDEAGTVESYVAAGAEEAASETQDPDQLDELLTTLRTLSRELDIDAHELLDELDVLLDEALQERSENDPDEDYEREHRAPSRREDDLIDAMFEGLRAGDL